MLSGQRTCRESCLGGSQLSCRFPLADSASASVMRLNSLRERPRESEKVAIRGEDLERPEEKRAG